MMLQDEFPFGIFNNHLILSKCQRQCISAYIMWYLMWRWLCLHKRAMNINNLTVDMSEK